MYQIDKIQSLKIGVQGENNATNIVIDMSSWANEFPSAQFHVLFKPYNSPYVYPMTSSYDSDHKVLTWRVGASATAVVGVGYTEVRAQDSNGLIKKTRIIPTVVEDSVSGIETDPPEPQEEWVTEVLDAATAAVNSGLDAEAYAVGQRNGEDVGPTDPAYHNNAKYYAQEIGPQVPAAVAEWLDDHPEATTTVDYRITDKIFATVGSMIDDYSLANGEKVRTNGYYASGDGGGAYYVVSNTASGIYETLGNGKYALLVPDKQKMLNILQVGAHNDGSADVSTLVNTYTSNYAIYFPAGIYKVSSPLNIKNPITGQNWTETSNYVASNKPKDITVLQSAINSADDSVAVINLTGSFANAYIQKFDIICSGYEMGIKVDGMTVRMTNTFVDKVSIRSLKSTGIYLGKNSDETPSGGTTGRSRLIQVGQVTIMGLLNYDTIGIETHSPDLVMDHLWICTKVGLNLYFTAFVHIAHIYCGPLGVDTNHWWNNTKGIVLHTLSRLTADHLYLDTCNSNIHVDGYNYSFSAANIFVYGDASPLQAGSGYSYSEFITYGSENYKDTGIILIGALDYACDRPYEASMTPISVAVTNTEHIKINQINGRIYTPASPTNGGNFNKFPQTKGLPQDCYKWVIDQNATVGNCIEIATLRYNTRPSEAIIKVMSTGYKAILRIYKSNYEMTPNMYVTELQTTPDYNLTFYYTVDTSSKIIHIYAVAYDTYMLINVEIESISSYMSAIAYGNVSYETIQERFKFFEVAYDSNTMSSPTVNNIDATLAAQLRQIL